MRYKFLFIYIFLATVMVACNNTSNKQTPIHQMMEPFI